MVVKAVDKALARARAARADYEEEVRWLSAGPETRRHLKIVRARAERRAARILLRAELREAHEATTRKDPS